MRSKLLKTKIQNFRLVLNDIVYSTVENEIFFRDELIYKSNCSIQEIFLNEKGIITNTIYGEGLEIDINDWSVKLHEGEVIKYLDSELRIMSIRRETVISNFIKNTSTIKPYRIFIFSLQKESDRLIYYEGNNLTNVNLNINVTSLVSDVDYSSFSLSTLGSWFDGAIEKQYQVLEFSSVYKNTLVSTLNNGGILLLDIEKGQPKQFFKDAKVRGGVFQVSEGSPIFQGLKHYTFVEINAESGELVRQVDIQHELKRVANIPDESPCWLTVGTSVYHEGLFYFYGDKNFLGVFDPKQEKIIDYHWFEFESKGTQLKRGIENLQVKGDEIYCLDTANTLHTLSINA